MKIRIKGNSLRYRLTRPEVATFAATGQLSETVNFGSTALLYTLQRSDIEQLSASFIDNQIILYVPQRLVNDWAINDKTGFDHQMVLPGSAETLYLLVEKDFTCLENVAEDQTDNYPNPLKEFT